MPLTARIKKPAGSDRTSKLAPVVATAILLVAIATAVSLFQ